MAAGFYNSAVALAFTGGLDWSTETFRLLLTDERYSPDLTTDVFLADIPEAYRVASVGLTGCAVTGGVLTAGNVSFADVVSTERVTSMVVYRVETATIDAVTGAPLVFCTTRIEGLPRTFPTATDITVLWDQVVGGVHQP